MDEVSSSRGSARLKGLFKALLSVAVAWVSLGAASAQQEAQPSSLTLQQAVREILHEILAAMGGDGGLIGVDKYGGLVLEFSTEGMFRGARDSGGRREIAIY